jgi:hypothetical protein
MRSREMRSGARCGVLLTLLALNAGLALRATASAEGNRGRATSAKALPTTAKFLFSLTEKTTNYGVGIKALKRADVARDIAVALRTGDRRLIGIMGYALVVPGIEMRNGAGPQGCPIVTIAGTSDAILSREQAKFQRLLRRCAEEYNRGVAGLGGGRTKR